MELTVSDLRDLLVDPKTAPVPNGPERDFGFCIVVLDRGFVYIGHVVIAQDMCVIHDARNIRYWGTDEKRPGLGWLAANGPTEKSRVDSVGIVRAPMRAVISLIDAKEETWKKI